MSRLSRALEMIDAANGEDPTLAPGDEGPMPAELLYGRRMSAMLDRFEPQASELLKVAARAQHIRRWRVARASYPMTRAGYHRWRSDLKRLHAQWAGEIAVACGYDQAEIARIGAMIRKDDLKGDSETQTLEDVACLVFLEHYAVEFAARHEEAKVVAILAKTLPKMSERGRAAAMAAQLPPAIRAALLRAGQSAGGAAA